MAAFTVFKGGEIKILVEVGTYYGECWNNSPRESAAHVEDVDEVELWQYFAFQMISVRVSVEFTKLEFYSRFLAFSLQNQVMINFSSH